MKGRVFHLRDKLFHNENFVTALKSSELGESANKERCVQPLPDPDPPPPKTFTLCKAVQGDTSKMGEMPDLVNCEIQLEQNVWNMDPGGFTT